MTTLTSEKKNIARSDKEIFQFLSDLNNLGKLMPDRVINWQSTSYNCTFTIKGTADLGMQIVEKNEYNHLKLKEYEKVPFPFEMHIFLERKLQESTLVHIRFDADMNPVLSMMASKPLTNFLNMLVEKLAELHT